MKICMMSIKSNQARLDRAWNLMHKTKKGVVIMTKQDYEKALTVKREIMELKMVEDSGIQIDKKHLKSLERQLAGFKKQFIVVARNMDCEVANILELHYLCAWPFRMIQKYIYGCNFCESHPRKILERHFANAS